MRFKQLCKFNQGHTLEGLQAATLCGFAIGAMVMGLAATNGVERNPVEKGHGYFLKGFVAVT